MGRNKGIPAAIIVLALCVPAPTSAGERLYTQSDIAFATGISAGFQLATVAESFLYGQDYYPYLFLGTVSLEHLPALIYGTGDALLNGAVQVGLDAAFVTDTLIRGENALSSVLFNAAHKYAMFSAYAIYADMRSHSDDASYSRGIPELSFLDLALAPFDVDNLKEWYVAGYLGSFTAYAVISLCMADMANAVWSTGKAYIGGAELPVWAGVSLILLLEIPSFIMTGVGEESLFRGTYYEEMAYRLGEWPAKIMDGLYFTASHFPQKWDEIVTQAEEAPLSFALDCALSVGQAFWFQYIYEWKGLKAAVAAHAWTDVILFFCDWLVQAGVPNSAGFSINDRVLSLTYTIDL